MNFVFFLCVVALAISTTEACSCLPPSNKETFENAKFVVAGKIRGIRKDGFKLFYKVRLSKVFKGSKLFRKKSFWLSTASQGSLCGVTGLKRGQTYLLSGNVHQGKFSFSNCGNFYMSKSQVAKEIVQLDHCKISLQKFLHNPHFKCPTKKCPLNQVWNNGCKSCPRICPQFDQRICTRECRAGCECPKSAPFSHPTSGKCLTHQECTPLKHCEYGGKKYLPGQKIDKYCGCSDGGFVFCA